MHSLDYRPEVPKSYTHAPKGKAIVITIFDKGPAHLHIALNLGLDSVLNSRDAMEEQDQWQYNKDLYYYFIFDFLNLMLRLD